MSNTIDLNSRRQDAGSSSTRKIAAEGQVVAMKNVHLPAVIETVRVLRMVDDGALLDAFNRRKR